MLKSFSFDRRASPRVWQELNGSFSSITPDQSVDDSEREISEATRIEASFISLFSERRAEKKNFHDDNSSRNVFFLYYTAKKKTFVSELWAVSCHRRSGLQAAIAAFLDFLKKKKRHSRNLLHRPMSTADSFLASLS